MGDCTAENIENGETKAKTIINQKRKITKNIVRVL